MHVALLTGRAGSTLADKNFRKVNGRPMCAYSCAAANMSGVFDKTFCSSNSKEILSISSAYGFKPIERPEHLSSATARHVDVIEHFLGILTERNIQLSTLTVLMANSATVLPVHLAKAYSALSGDNSLTSAVPVIVEQDHHPFRAKRVENGLLKTYFEFDQEISSNRQDLPINHFLTHSFWSIRIQEGNRLPYSKCAQPWTFLGDRCFPIVLEQSIDVHHEQDFEHTSNWLTENTMVF